MWYIVEYFSSFHKISFSFFLWNESWFNISLFFEQWKEFVSSDYYIFIDNNLKLFFRHTFFCVAKKMYESCFEDLSTETTFATSMTSGACSASYIKATACTGTPSTRTALSESCCLIFFFKILLIFKNNLKPLTMTTSKTMKNARIWWNTPIFILKINSRQLFTDCWMNEWEIGSCFIIYSPDERSLSQIMTSQWYLYLQ